MARPKMAARFNQMQSFITDRQKQYLNSYADKWQVNPQEAMRRLLDKMIDSDSEFNAINVNLGGENNERA